MRSAAEAGRNWRRAGRIAGGLVVALLAAGAAAADAPPTVRVSVAAARAGLAPLAGIDTLVAPGFDRDQLVREDQAADAAGAAPRFAVPWQVTVTPESHGTWELLDARTQIWRLRIFAPGAQSLNLGFTRYHLPPGARLTLHSTDDRFAVRPFTAADNAAHGELWTPIVATDDLMLELVVPVARRSEVELTLTAVNQGYRAFGVRDEKSGACNVDVVCPQGAGWRGPSRAVAVLSLDGFRFCTGFLVNDTARDRRPYLMTANHCDVGAGQAPSLVAYWRYENSTCRPPGSAASGGRGDGRLDLFSTGAIFRAASAASDFTLLELDQAPPAAAEVFFAGWNRATGDFPSVVTIHHPNGDEKRITLGDHATATTTYLGSTSPGDGTHIHAFWTLGVTEPGSSGSPLFDPQQRVVGQLHGGPSFCGGSDLSDYYGRFSVSWQGAGSDATRLSTWLDRLGTGALAIDGLDSKPTGRPAPPLDLAAKALAPGAVELSWTDGSTNETSFAIQMRSPGGDFRAIGSVPADTTTASIGGLETATEYTFRVRARNDSGASSFSNEATVTTLGPPGPCLADRTTLCLLGGRFAVRAGWTDGQGNRGDATAAAIPGAPDAGLFWFYSPANPELMVKVLSACTLPDPGIWVFAAGATTLEHTLSVVDTRTGAARTYVHAAGTPPGGVADTTSFTVCP